MGKPAPWDRKRIERLHRAAQQLESLTAKVLVDLPEIERLRAAVEARSREQFAPDRQSWRSKAEYAEEALRHSVTVEKMPSMSALMELWKVVDAEIARRNPMCWRELHVRAISPATPPSGDAG